jgi:hypothetical protein
MVLGKKRAGFGRLPDADPDRLDAFGRSDSETLSTEDDDDSGFESSDAASGASIALGVDPPPLARSDSAVRRRARAVERTKKKKKKKRALILFFSFFFFFFFSFLFCHFPPCQPRVLITTHCEPPLDIFLFFFIFCKITTEITHFPHWVCWPLQYRIAFGGARDAIDETELPDDVTAEDIFAAAPRTRVKRVCLFLTAAVLVGLAITVAVQHSRYVSGGVFSRIVFLFSVP